MRKRPIPRRLLVASILLAIGALPAVAGVRLGSAVVPTFQSIDLRIDPSQESFSGSTTIRLDVRQPTERFRFHAEEMKIASLELTGPDGKVEVTYAPDEDATVAVSAAAPLAAGEYTLAVAFSHLFDAHAVGLYRMEADGAAYAFTQFEPDDARLAFPCWDEPGFKHPYQVTVEVPEGQVAVSNTPVASERHAEGWHTIVFAPTRPLPSYLVAIAAGPLESVEIPGMGVPGRIYTVRGQSRLAATAAGMAAPLMHALEAWFGTPYPYEKLDFVAIPEYWPGAMENAGLITYADRILLNDPASATTSWRRTLAKVIAHEMAHQWFGDWVTMAWWDDLWLNESFADWMGDRITAEVYPELRVDLASLQDGQQIMTTDARPSSPAIRKPVESTENLLQDVRLDYDKGKTVIRSFEHWMGAEAFQRGVRSYLAAHAWGNATSADLAAALDQASGKPVAAVLSGFIDQPGLPLVELRPLSDGRVELRQRRFHNFGVAVEPLSWRIPVSLRFPTASGTETRTVLLTGEQGSFDLGTGTTPEWIFPNAGGSGYYRWQVPLAMLSRIVAAAPQSLSAGERIALLGNLGALLDAGEMHGDAFLEALAGFAEDPEPLVLGTVLDLLDGVELAFVPAELRGEFGAYVGRLLRPALARYGFAAVPGEEETVSLVRPRVLRRLGVLAHDAEVLAWAQRTSAAYLADPAGADPAVVSVALDLAARSGDAARFDDFRQRFESATTPEVRQRFLGTLGEFRDPALVGRALDYVLAGPLRPQELFAIPGTLSSDPAVVPRVFDWGLAHYDALAAKLPPDFRAFLPYIAAGCSLERLERAEAFFAQPEHSPPGTAKMMSQVAEGVRDCAALRAREGAAVAAYVRAGARAPSPGPASE
jgi:alanyl aminopeptidase